MLTAKHYGQPRAKPSLLDGSFRVYQMPTRIAGNSRCILGLQGVRTWSPISDQVDQVKMKGSIMWHS
jgi:hypothetical protein